MATYLALSQKLRQECVGPGSSAQPSAVTSQVGQLKQFVDWIADAWDDIQNRYENWRWMRKAMTVNTVAGTDSYAYTVVTDVSAAGFISRFGRWWADDSEDPFKCYLNSGGVSGEYRLRFLPWESFKYLYKIGTQNNGQPIHVSVDHADNIVLGPKPDDVYVVTGDFQRSKQRLSADADIPEMPTQYHDAIVYWAMEKYAADLAAHEKLARGVREGRRLIRALELNQRPKMFLSGPMA
jgi:hypothetical protein